MLVWLFDDYLFAYANSLSKCNVRFISHNTVFKFNINVFTSSTTHHGVYYFIIAAKPLSKSAFLQFISYNIRLLAIIFIFMFFKKIKLYAAHLFIELIQAIILNNNNNCKSYWRIFLRQKKLFFLILLLFLQYIHIFL